MSFPTPKQEVVPIASLVMGTNNLDNFFGCASHFNACQKLYELSLQPASHMGHPPTQVSYG